MVAFRDGTVVGKEDTKYLALLVAGIGYALEGLPNIR